MVGQIALANASHDYTQQDLALVERLADLYAIALERHWAEAALVQRTEELQRRNEELDAFAHTVAHDLKNPLSLVIGYSEALAEDEESLADKEREHYLDTIIRSGHKVNEIIDELLLLAEVRKRDVKATSLDMCGIVEDAWLRLIAAVDESQAEIVLPDTWPPALGHGPWVEEVWANYLSNAIKYGGRPPRVKVGAVEQDDGMVRFWVRDNGPGLTAEDQAQLFTAFTQLARPSGDGHGLGLSIVRRIVEKLGGQVAVESEGVPGRGCVFSFTLPAAKANPPEVE